jgi:propionyl-CoA synthetase
MVCRWRDQPLLQRGRPPQTRPEQAALIHVSSETGAEQTYTYRQLHEEVSRFAAIMQAQGVGKGDRVLIPCR